MTLSRRTFLAALAGLPVLGRAVAKPEPTDETRAEDAILDFPAWPNTTITTSGGGGVMYYNVAVHPQYGVVAMGPGRDWTVTLPASS